MGAIEKGTIERNPTASISRLKLEPDGRLIISSEVTKNVGLTAGTEATVINHGAGLIITPKILNQFFGKLRK